MSRQPPLYLVANGTHRPAHVAGVAPCLVPPEVSTPAALNCVTYNGAAFGGEEWQALSPGVWVHYRHEDLPTATQRTNASAGYRVAGFIVPRLVGLDGVAAVGYFGPNGWTIPERYKDAVGKLLEFLDYVGPVTDDHARLAADVVGLNYHVSLAELAHFQVLDRDAILGILKAACSIPPEA